MQGNWDACQSLLQKGRGNVALYLSGGVFFIGRTGGESLQD